MQKKRTYIAPTSQAVKIANEEYLCITSNYEEIPIDPDDPIEDEIP